MERNKGLVELSNSTNKLGDIMSLKNLNQSNFDAEVSGPGLKVVKFGADWCGPCRMIAPVLEGLTKKHGDVGIYEVNVDENPALSMKFGVRGIPAVYFLKNGQVIDSFAGFRGESEIDSKIQTLKK